MEREEFIYRFKQLFVKLELLTNESYKDVCISIDPDYDMDYGIDGLGNIIIDKESTFFPISKLVDMKYRVDMEDKLYGTYIVFIFENNVRLCMYWGECYSVPGCRGRGLQIEWKDYCWDPFVTYRIINAMSCGWTGWWDRNDDFIIDNDILVAYIGEGGIVNIPEGVRKIHMKAFRCAFITKVTIPSSLEEIDEGAFEGNTRLKEIDFNNVRSIGSYAFKFTGISEVTLPKTLEYIGDGVFEHSNILSLQSITNKSSLRIDHSLYKDTNKEIDEIDDDDFFERMNDEICERINKESMIPVVNYYLLKIQNRQEFEHISIDDENYTIVDEINNWVYMLSPNNMTEILIMKRDDNGFSEIDDGLILSCAKSRLIQKIKSEISPDTLREYE